MLRKQRGGRWSERVVAAKVDYLIGPSPESIAAADLNGDGNLDIVTTNIDANSVSVFRGNGDGTFAPRVDYPSSASPRSVVATDLNGDGRFDLTILNGNSVSVLFNICTP